MNNSATKENSKKNYQNKIEELNKKFYSSNNLYSFIGNFAASFAFYNLGCVMFLPHGLQHKFFDVLFCSAIAIFSSTYYAGYVGKLTRSLCHKDAVQKKVSEIGKPLEWLNFATGLTVNIASYSGCFLLTKTLAHILNLPPYSNAAILSILSMLGACSALRTLSIMHWEHSDELQKIKVNQSEIQTGNNEEVAAAKEIARQKDSDWPQPYYLIGVMGATLVAAILCAGIGFNEVCRNI